MITIEKAENGYVIKHNDTMYIANGYYDVADIVRAIFKSKIEGDEE